MLSNYSQKWGLSLIIVDILPFYLCDKTLWIKRIRKKRLGCYQSLEVLEEQSLSVGIRKLMTHLTSSNSKCKAESALRMMQVLEILQFPPLIEFLQSFICEYTFPGKIFNQNWADMLSQASRLTFVVTETITHHCTLKATLTGNCLGDNEIHHILLRKNIELLLFRIVKYNREKGTFKINF